MSLSEAGVSFDATRREESKAMDILEIAHYFAALLLVLALIGAAGLIARKWGVPGVTRAVADKRLAMVETLMIGPRQKLFIVRRDDAEHLIFSGPDGVCLVENIPSPPEFR